MSHALKKHTLRGCETTRSAIRASGRRSTADAFPPTSPNLLNPKRAIAPTMAMTGASTHTSSDGVAPRPAAQPSDPIRFD